ncbi:MAG: hypothetical protein JWN92_222 [Candidatus Acidoferrum typicum]|nr:hypothetical protein [Candidatus Acidoferrum typicum]
MDGCRRSNSSGKLHRRHAGEDSASMRNQGHALRPPLQTTGHLCDPRNGGLSAEGLPGKHQMKMARALLSRCTLQVKCSAPRRTDSLAEIGLDPGLLRPVAAAPAPWPWKVSIQSRRAASVPFQSAFGYLSRQKFFAHLGRTDCVQSPRCCKGRAAFLLKKFSRYSARPK